MPVSSDLPYRKPALPDASSKPAREFVYAPGEDRSFNLKLALFALTIAVFGAGGILYQFIGPFSIFAIVGAYWYVFRCHGHATKRSGRIVMVVDDPLLRITQGKDATLVPLVDIYAVTLEHEEKAHSMLQIDRPGIDNPKIFEAGTIRISRVVLRLRGKRLYPIGSNFRDADTAAAAAGKLRIWLRAHGWLPKDERDGDGSQS